MMFWLLVLIAAVSLIASIASVTSLLKATAPAKADANLLNKFTGLDVALKDIPVTVRDEGRMLREELHKLLTTHQQALEARLSSFSQAQNDQLNAMRKEASDGRAKLEEGLKVSTDAFAHTQATRLGETNQAMTNLAERLEKAHDTARELQAKALEGVAGKIQALTEANDKKQDAIREALTAGLDQLRKENEAKLEQMRATVEKNSRGRSKLAWENRSNWRATGLNLYTRASARCRTSRQALVISSACSPTSSQAVAGAKFSSACCSKTC
jgi:DNA recombination protein RmuC